MANAPGSLSPAQHKAYKLLARIAPDLVPGEWRLSDLDIDEISLVPAGANRKEFVLRKESTVPIDINSLIETDLENTEADALLKSLEGDARGAAEVLLKIYQGSADLLSPEQRAEIAKAAGAEMPAPEPVAEPEPAAEPEAEVAKEDEPVEDEAVANVRKEYEAKLETLAKEHAALAEAVEVKEYVEKAAAFTVPNLEPAELGPIMRDIDRNLSKEHADAMRKHFASVTELVKKSAVFNEFGKVETNDGSSTSATERVAKEIEAYKAEHPEAAQVDAIRAVAKADAALWTSYQAEQTSKNVNG